MKAREIDLKGRIIGDLTILYRAEMRGNRAYWRCKCSCGTELEISVYCLIKNTKKIQKSCRKCWFKTITKHGQWNGYLYKRWTSMKDRCDNSNNQYYYNYGGRGIAVCKRWYVFNNFFKDMGFPPTRQHTLERRNNNKGYSKINCYWATKKEQQANRRNNIILEYKGEKLILAEWARKLNMPFRTLAARLGYGWSIDDAINTPVTKKRDLSRIELNGKVKSLLEWCNEHTIPYEPVKLRLRKGWSVKTAITTPLIPNGFSRKSFQITNA